MCQSTLMRLSCLASEPQDTSHLGLPSTGITRMTYQVQCLCRLWVQVLAQLDLSYCSCPSWGAYLKIVISICVMCICMGTDVEVRENLMESVLSFHLYMASWDKLRSLACMLGLYGQYRTISFWGRNEFQETWKAFV